MDVSDDELRVLYANPPVDPDAEHRLIGRFAANPGHQHGKSPIREARASLLAISIGVVIVLMVGGILYASNFAQHNRTNSVTAPPAASSTAHTSPVATAMQRLTNTEWVLTTFNARGHASGLPSGDRALLRLRNTGAFSGSDVCNTFRGVAVIGSKTITFHIVTATAAACQVSVAVENVLNGNVAWSINGSTLIGPAVEQ